MKVCYFYTKEVYINLSKEDIDMVIGKLEDLVFEEYDVTDIIDISSDSELIRIGVGDMDDSTEDYYKVMTTLRSVFEDLDVKNVDYVNLREIKNAVRIL